MKKILIDLDVLTVAFWKGNKKEIAVKFLERVKKGEFVLITPSSLINLMNEWGYRLLSDKIKDFYFKYSEKIISNMEAERLSRLGNIVLEKIVDDLYSLGVKKEDAALIVITSIFDIDYLVTFNRKHLKNNGEKINEVLKKNGLKKIEIVEPDEI